MIISELIITFSSVLRPFDPGRVVDRRFKKTRSRGGGGAGTGSEMCGVLSGAAVRAAFVTFLHRQF